MSNFSIGVDLGGTNLRIAAVDEQGTLLEKIALDTQVKLGLDRVIRDMCGAVEQLAAKHKSGGSLHGIGIGVPGIIDMKTGMLRESANMPGWGGSPVQADIEQRLGTRVILENDANVAALGEMARARKRAARTRGLIAPAARLSRHQQASAPFSFDRSSPRWRSSCPRHLFYTRWKQFVPP